VTARALVLAVAAAGCTSYSNRLAATPLAEGTGEIGVAVDALVVERGREYIALPLPELSYRRGLRPGIDIGGTAHLAGSEASIRFALLDRGRVALAWAGGLALGFEPITNNTTDVVYARATPRLVAEMRPGHPQSQWPTWIVTAAPSLTFTGPATMFRGITDAARFIARPGAAIAARWQLAGTRAFWLELTAQPAYAIGDGWIAASYQSGAAFTF
jgi:hypothetical protein